MLCLAPRPQHYFPLRLQLLAQVSTLEAARGAAAAGHVLLFVPLHTLFYTPHRETTTNLQMYLTAGERGGALLPGLLPAHTLPRRGYHSIHSHMECPSSSSSRR